MSRGESVEEVKPVVTSGVLSQQVVTDNAGSDDDDTCLKLENLSESPMDKRIIIHSGEFGKKRCSRVANESQSSPRRERDLFQVVHMTSENMSGYNRIEDQFRTKIQSDQYGDKTHTGLGGSYDGTNIENDLRRFPIQSSRDSDDFFLKDHGHIPVSDGVSSALFHKVSKENAILKKELTMRQYVGDLAQLDRHTLQALEKENLHLKQELMKRGQERHQTRVEKSDATCSKDDLLKLLNAERDKNRKLEEKCLHLKEQVDTYAEDFRAEKKQQKDNEISWDIKFTKERAKNDKLTRQVKEKDLEIKRLQAQYREKDENTGGV